MFSSFRISEVSGSRNEEYSPKGKFKCGSPVCDKAFFKHHDLIRHEAVHTSSSPKRRCPYLKFKCKIKADEMHQLNNWFEHLVTGYCYACGCGESWPHRKGLYTHELKTGHACRPSDWDPERRERELAEKDRCYRNARAELLMMQEGGEGEWKDTWPESLPEYTRFMRLKNVKARPRRRLPRPSRDCPPQASSSYSAQLPLDPIPQQVQGAIRKSQRKRFRPYVLLVDPLVASPSAFSNASLLAIPEEIASTKSSTSEPCTSAPTLSPMGLLRHSVTPPVTPQELFPTSLEAVAPRSPDRTLTQEEADHLIDIAFSGGPPAWDIMANFLEGRAQASTKIPLSPVSASPYSEMVLTPRDLEALFTFTESRASCFDGGGTVSPQQLHRSDFKEL